VTHLKKIIPYKNKYWRGTKFGKLANRHTITKFKSRQYIFLVVSLVAFEWFCQINISPNLLFQQIAKYYIRQYLFLYGNMEKWALFQVAKNWKNTCLCYWLCFAELKYYQRRSERLFELILVFQGGFWCALY